MHEDNMTEDMGRGMPGADNDESPDGAELGRESPYEALIAERDLLVAERAELQDLMRRRQADFDNYRRRVEREKAEMRDYASEEAVAALLPILDDFERGLRAMPEEDGPVREYARGIDLIRQRLEDALTKLGLERVESKGKLFDPNLHNAIQKEAAAGLPDQTVIEEYQSGYRFKGRLLRAAMVKVAVNP